MLTNHFMVERTLPKNALRKILRDQGAKRVSDDALEVFKEVLESEIASVTRDALQYAHHAKRKTILDTDVRLSLRHK
ncbi:MAG: histone H3/H4 [Candidatus Woesearchaeota archaeon]|jgi:histone H3/H4